ncbi:MAG: SBBP repeat-containing protein [Bryobacterales bacterium]|nr:SBBP repeat-containing protein [Bryobacterales bacterium]
MLRRSPFPFEPNLGQTHPDVLFLARADGFRVFVTETEIVYAGSGGVSRMRLVGMRSGGKWTRKKRLGGHSSYFIGREEAKWRSAIPHYEGVERRGVYEGVDVEVVGQDHKIEYRFSLAPDADPRLIRIRLDAAPAIAPNGDLVLRSAAGEFRHRAPMAFQGTRRIAVSFELGQDGEVGFALGPYDPRQPLTIDPVISYHYFHGGLNAETAVGAAVDAVGDLYYTGTTNSLDFPVAGSPYRDFNSGNFDIFLARVNPSGGIVFSTYIGGAGNEEPGGIAVDPEGHSSIIATTFSTDLPVQTGVFQMNYGGNGDAVALRMSPTGFTPPLLTYLGGSGPETGTSVALDASGVAYYTGYTSSANFPTRTPRQANHGGGEDLFLVKIHPGGEVLFSTYFGGEGDERAHGVATDKDGNAHLTGKADCAQIAVGPTIGQLNGNDVFVMKWKASGDGALWITCLGGNGADTGRAIAVDSAGNSYVTGATKSTNFPIAAAVQQAFGGNQNNGPNGDAFALKLNPAGTSLMYSTYLGGPRDDVGQSVSVNGAGEAFVAGLTQSPSFPSSGPPLVVPTERAAFLTRLSGNGLSILGSWFLDGVNDGDRYSVGLDAKGTVYMTGGATANLRLPVTAAPALRAFRSPLDALIVKLSTGSLQVMQDTFSPSFLNTQDFDLVQRIVNRGPEASEHVTFRGILPVGLSAVSCFASGVTCSTTGNSYRVDVERLQPGAGIEVRASLRPTAGAFPGVAQQVNVSATSDTYDPRTTDNVLTTTLFGSATQPACNYALSNQSFEVGAAATSVTVTVTAPFSCPWTATLPVDWISFASPNAASGSSNISFNLQANPLPIARLGSAVVAGHRVVFVQAAAGTAVSPFTDVAVTHPFFPFISLMKSNAITQGCTATTYCPDDLITRGQMAVFLVRSVLGGDAFAHPSTPYFTDVAANHPQFRYIQKLRELGITAGCTATEYCPGEPVTRAQMAAFLVRGKLAVAPTQAFPFPTAFSFSDVNTGSVFYPSIQKMRELGVTLGCSASQYCPEGAVTRGQMAAFLIRAFQAP